MSVSTKKQVSQLTRTGRYREASAVLRNSEEAAQRSKSARGAKLQAEQDVERSAFARAKEQFVVNAQYQAQLRRQSLEESDWRYREDRRLADEEDLEQYAAHQEELIRRRPITTSQAVLDLRCEEKQLSIQNKFAESEVVSLKGSRLHAHNLQMTRQMQQDELEGKIHSRKLAQEAAERQSEARKEYRRQLDELHQSEQMSLAKSSLSHIENGMLAAQAKQQKLLQTYGYLPQPSAAEISKLQRGTKLQTRVLGNPESPPPLCALYGHFLDDSAS